MIIIGITGTIGAGKGTVVEYLAQEKGLAHYSARDFLIAEVKRRGLPVNRDTMTPTANDLRRIHGPAYIAESLYKLAIAGGRNSIIESLRSPGEVSFLKQNKDFFLRGVDAPPEIRYERIHRRSLETDHISFEKFKEDDAREMTSADPFAQNIRACLDVADAMVYNEGTLAELNETTDKVLESFFAQKHI